MMLIVSLTMVYCHHKTGCDDPWYYEFYWHSVYLKSSEMHTMYENIFTTFISQMNNTLPSCLMI